MISSPLYYLHAYRYVYQNPVRSNICGSALDYRYSTLRALVGLDKTIIPIERDDTLFENFESTLKWLLEVPKQNDDANMRLALRRKEFKLPRDESTKKKNFLETLDSVPQHFWKGIPET